MNQRGDITELYHTAANNPPCQHCDGAPCGPCVELADIETRIEDLHSRLRDLHEKHRAARSNRNNVHNRSMLQLPLEIVSHIFVLCLQPLNLCFSKSEGFPFTIIAVCRAWRVLALSTPSLWSSSAVNISTPDVGHINHRLMHSGSLPISLHLYSMISRRGTPNTTEVLNLIKKNLYRTRTLCLDLFDEHINEFSSTSGCPSSMPLLQELHVHGRIVIEGSSELKLSTTPPRPQTVYVDSYFANDIVLDWSGVSNLTLQDTTIKVSLGLLSMAKRLVDLTLNILAMETWQLGLYSSNTPIVHHSIRHLALEGGVTAHVIFSFSTMTSLDTLSILNLTELSPKFAAFLRRSSCALRCLRLEFTEYFSADQLIDVLSETPALQELSLFDGYHRETTIDSLLERLSLTPSRSSENGIFLPCLRSFEYAGYVSSYAPFLGIFSPSEGIPARALQKVDIKVPAHTLDRPPFLSRSDLQRILHLQKAGKHISITANDSTGFDILKRSMDIYCLSESSDEGG